MVSEGAQEMVSKVAQEMVSKVAQEMVSKVVYFKVPDQPNLSTSRSSMGQPA